MLIDARTLPPPVDDWFREHYPRKWNVREEKTGELAAYCRYKTAHTVSTRFFEADVPPWETEEYWNSLRTYFESFPPDAVIFFG